MSTLGPNRDGLGEGNQAHNVGSQFGAECGKCGARRQDRQLGLEPTPDEYITSMDAVFREVRRVLKDSGTLWLNIGDSYANTGGAESAWSTPTEQRKKRVGNARLPNRSLGGLKPKDLVGIPWMLAFALRADGWYLRSDIIWSKPNPMPESVTDRPTKAHEYVFLLSKQPRYFFDQNAVREPHGDNIWTRKGSASGEVVPSLNRAIEDGERGDSRAWTPTVRQYNPAGRNVRSVWEIATQPYPEAHFATYPEELVRRCILAGTSERGVCPVCGKPWEREQLATGADNHRVRADVGDWIREKGGNADGKRSLSGATYRRQREAGDWRSTCNHDAAPVPATVLDPFMGSGTTGLVARKHGRRCIGVELNVDYCELAALRLAQQSLFAVEVEERPVIPAARGLTGGAYSPPGQSPHSNARDTS